MNVAELCEYNGVTFRQGQRWDDGCDLQCVCENEDTGYYRCNQRYGVYNYWNFYYCILQMCTVNIFIDISFNLNQILCCDHSLEANRRADSNEWSQHRNRLRNKKVSI